MFDDDIPGATSPSTPAPAAVQLPNSEEELLPPRFPDEPTAYAAPAPPPVAPAAPATPAPATPADNSYVANTPPATAPVSSLADEDLLNIKRSALGELTPLISQLEQTPEDKFKTTMMMIQASDDKSLLQSAYETALKIEDEKFRAQALLDVVNEINYFTHLSETS